MRTADGDEELVGEALGAEATAESDTVRPAPDLDGVRDDGGDADASVAAPVDCESGRGAYCDV